MREGGDHHITSSCEEGGLASLLTSTNVGPIRLSHAQHQLSLRFVSPLTVGVERGWRIGTIDAFRPNGHGLVSRSFRHVGTWASPSLTVACGASASNSGTIS